MKHLFYPIILGLLLLLHACSPTETNDDNQLRVELDSLCARLLYDRVPADSARYLAEYAKEQALKLDYQDALWRSEMELAIMDFQNGDQDLADSCFQVLLDTHEMDSLGRGRAYYFQATHRLLQGQYKTGDSLMVLAEGYAHNYPRLQYNIAMNCANGQSFRKNRKKALEYLDRAGNLLYTRKMTKDSARFYHLRGGVLVQMGQLEEAESDIIKAKNLFITDHDSLEVAKALNTLFAIEIYRGNPEAAYKRLEEALAIHPKQGPPETLAMIYKNRGSTLSRLGRKQESLQSYWKAYDFSAEAQDSFALIRTRISIGIIYKDLGRMAEAASCFREASEDPMIRQRPVTWASAKVNQAKLLRDGGYLEEAQKLGEEAIEIMGDKGSAQIRGSALNDLASTYRVQNQEDKARTQFEKVLKFSKQHDLNSTWVDAHKSLGKMDLENGQPASALAHGQAALHNQPTQSDQFGRLGILFLISKAQFQLGNLPAAIDMGEQSMVLAEEMESEEFLREISEALSVYYEAQGKPQKGLDYARTNQKLVKSYIKSENEAVVHELQTRLDLDQKNTDIQFLSQENKLQEEELKNRMLWIGLLALLFLALGLLFFFWRKRNRLLRKNELLKVQVKFAEDKMEMENSMNEMRLLALQARLNPHFVFNCLVVLQSLIRKQQNDTAMTYLRDFSRLTRMVFEISQKPSLPLSEEIEFLQLYTKLENKRLLSDVTLEVEVQIGLDAEELFIPPLLLQPILENCFKHGFSESHEDKSIKLSFKKSDQGLQVIVSDNGKGLTGSVVKNRPSGIRITRKRLAILTHYEPEENTVILKNNPHGPGTRAELMIPLLSA